jgi:hypothetical protein
LEQHEVMIKDPDLTKMRDELVNELTFWHGTMRLYAVRFWQLLLAPD